MIIKVVLFCLLISSLFSYEDLGTVANTYEVKEQNLKEMFKDSYDKLDKKELVNNYKTAIESSFTKSANLPESKVTQKYTTENYVILDYDLKARADGKVLKKAGEKIYPNLPANQSQTICFINAEDKILLKPTITALGHCDIYMLAGIDIREGYEILPNKEVYPYDKNYEKRFNLKVLPTKVKIYDKYFDFTTIDMNVIKQRLREKGDIL